MLDDELNEWFGGELIWDILAKEYAEENMDTIHGRNQPRLNEEIEACWIASSKTGPTPSETNDGSTKRKSAGSLFAA